MSANAAVERNARIEAAFQALRTGQRPEVDGEELGLAYAQYAGWLRTESDRLRALLGRAIEAIAGYELDHWHDRGIPSDPGYNTTPEADALREEAKL